jgi:hypothetical protein
MVNAASSETCAACQGELFGSQESAFGEAGARAGQGYGAESQRAWSPAIGPFTNVGAVLTPTIEVFKNNLWLITKIVFVVFAPYEIFKAMEVSSGRSDWQVSIGILFMALVCKALLSPALIYALVTVMRTGRAPGVSEAYRWGLGRLGRIMICAVLAWILELLGFIALIIPGIILGLAFEIVYPMAALENRSPTEILKRSWNLTKGYRGRIFVASLVIALLCWVVAMPVGLLTGIFVMTNLNYWPVSIAAALITDVVYQSMTVLSLIIYLSLVTHHPQDVIIEE